MFIKDMPFKVEFSSYSERHFCKDFIKKYKAKQWIETQKTIVATLERAYSFQEKALIDNIKFSLEHDMGIFKLDFRVAGTKTSPKGSGNRVIFYLCNSSSEIKILLVYGKNHCKKGQSETSWILEKIKDNYPEYKHLL
jgi:hypothetical protein